MLNRRYWPSLLAITAAVLPLAHLAAPDIAGACEMVPGGRQDVLLPSPDATDVPLNTRVWIDDQQAGPELAVLAEDGSEIAIDTHRIFVGSAYTYVLIVTPRVLLLPGQVYEVWTGYLELTDQITWFSTGTDVALAPPPLPSEVRRTSRSFNPCASICNDAGAEVELWLSGEALIVVDVGNEETLEPDDPSGLVTVTTQDGHVLLDTFGSWPGKANQRKSIRYGTFDLAGNFSGWTEPDTVRMPGVPAMCTCSTTPRSTPVLWVVLVLLWTWWRRAERKTLRSRTRR